jgi:outer membrane receptor protein involved in Fe transport
MQGEFKRLMLRALLLETGAAALMVAMPAVAQVSTTGDQQSQAGSATAPISPQDAEPTDAQAAPEDSGALEEIVVTATRRADTVNRVPLSITAVTQEGLDRRGLQSAADLQRTVPALTITGAAGGVQNFSIRGIVATSGAATTGVYLDDTPLQRRNSAGVQQNNGTPAPTLFDLDRVEVLRGPQGTLYGGSSQGGTIRFITPAPDLDVFSGRVMVQGSTVVDGDIGYEAGVAFGGPLIQDRLGVRVSAFYRNQGGYIDLVDPYTNGALREENVNGREEISVRAALAYAPTDESRATLAYFYSRQSDEGGPSGYDLPLNQTVATAEYCFDTRRTVASVPSAIAPVPCPPREAQPDYIYRRERVEYGPFPYLGKYRSIYPRKNEVSTDLHVASLTLDQSYGTFDVKSITSYIDDATIGDGTEFNQLTAQQRLEGFPAAQPNRNAWATGFPLFAPWPDFHVLVDDGYNKRHGFMTEVRGASTGDGPFSWVVGAFASRIEATSEYFYIGDIERQVALLFGLRADQRYSERLPDGTLRGLPALFNGIVTTRLQNLTDEEVAGFGELNYTLFDQLKLTAGVRVSSVSFDYDQKFYGPASGWNVPTVANGGIVSGSVSESPITPKFGIQYQFEPNTMVYASVSKGFRTGGVNSPISESICGAGLANVGLTVADIPTTYDADTVWNYELGAKLRLFNGRVQANSSIYRIDWTGVQLNVGIPGCGQTYTQNAGEARSQGFDTEISARLAGFTMEFNLGYTDAKYTATALGPDPVGPVLPTPIVREGDTFPVPNWQFAVGLQYDFELAGNEAYARVDYQYTGDYFRSPGPGVNAYSPDNRVQGLVDVWNLRAGYQFGGLAIEGFVNNVLNSDAELARTANRGGCALNTTTGVQDPACPIYVTYNPFTTVVVQRPRQFGLRLTQQF